MTQPVGKISLADSKTTMSSASTPPAPGASPVMASITSSGEIFKKTSDFQFRKLRTKKEDEEIVTLPRGSSACSEGSIFI